MIKEIHYERTYNLGNYQSERIGVTASPEADQTAEDTLRNLIHWVAQQHLRAENARHSTPRQLDEPEY